MNKKILQKGLALFSVLSVSMSLSACGSGIASSKKPVAASKAFNTKSIWYAYCNNGIVDKNSRIDAVLLFDGNGKVTVYNTNNLTFSKLKGLKKDDIIKLAKKQDKAYFDQSKSDALATYKQNIEKVTEKHDMLKNDCDSKNYKAIPYFYNESELLRWNKQDIRKWYEKRLRPLKLGIGYYTAIKNKLESIEYKEPKAVKFTLNGITDRTGNIIKQETLSFPQYSYFEKASLPIDKFKFIYFENQDKLSLEDFDLNNNVEGIYVDNLTVDEMISKIEKSTKKKVPDWTWNMLAYCQHETSNMLTLGAGVQTVYNMHFGGYANLVMQVDEKQGGFTWDATNAKGVQIDK